MELLKTQRRPNDFGDVLHIVAQVAFVALIGALVLIFQLPAVAFLLAVLSKWRIFAVRPRYWRANLITNLVDLLFLVGVTALIIKPLVIPTIGTGDAGATLHLATIVWLLLLAVWQVWLKPQTGRPMVLLQAGIAQFVALVALCTYLSTTPFLSAMNQVFLLLLVAGSWITGYGSARHALSSFDAEPKISFFAYVWGFALASMAWLFGHWMHVYVLSPDLQIPQLSLVALLISFCAIQAYDFQRHVSLDKPQARVRTKQSLRTLYISAMFTGVLLVLVIASTHWSVPL